MGPFFPLIARAISSDPVLRRLGPFYAMKGGMERGTGGLSRAVANSVFSSCYVDARFQNPLILLGVDCLALCPVAPETGVCDHPARRPGNR